MPHVTLCKQLIDVLLRAGRETLPQCNHKDRGIPYWNDEVESVRETAMFWHWLWVDSDRHRHGHVAAIMRKTRAIVITMLYDTLSERSAS